MHRLVIVFALCLSTAASWAVETVKWDRTVIPVDLIVGVEQLIQFPGSATVGLPVELAADDMLRHLFAGDTAYWKAVQPFETKRIKVRIDETGEFILFDVSARSVLTPPQTVEPLRVVIDTLPSSAEAERKEDPPITMFDLVRYAAQSEYAPERLVAPLPGVRAIENKVSSELSSLYNHTDRRKVDMFVEQMFVADGWYVTSIRIKNRTAEDVTIEPSRMQHTVHSVVNGVSNHFVASAMVYRTIRARGHKLDTTYMYVITDRPFASVIDL